MLLQCPGVGKMKRTGQDDAPPSEMSPAAWALIQPWWLHPHCNEAAPTPPAPDARRTFAAMATQIGLAAWMLSMALTSACVPDSRFGGAAPAAAHLDWFVKPLAGERPVAPATLPAATPATRISALAPGTH